MSDRRKFDYFREYMIPRKKRERFEKVVCKFVSAQ